MTRVMLAAMLCLVPPALAAADPPPVAVAPAAAAPVLDTTHSLALDPTSSADLPVIDNSGYLLFKTLVVLALVVAIIYLTLNVGARRLFQLAPSSQALVQVIERVPLDAKKSLFIVSAAGEYLLVGSTETGLNLISKLPTDEVMQALAKRDALRAAGPTFLSRLQALAPASRKPPV